MTTCDDGTERLDPDLGEGVDPFVGGESPLVGELERGNDLNLNRDGDVHDNVARALAAYVGSLVMLHKGREHRLNRVTLHQADAGDESVPFPVAAVYGLGNAEGRYAGPPNSPQRVTDELDSGDPFRPAWLYETATYTFDQLMVDVYCDDDVSRTAWVMAIEEAASPYRGAGGFRLRMAGYYNAIARYALVGQARRQNPLEAVANIWVATFRFAVAAPTLRVHTSPRATVRSQSVVVG